MLVALLVTFITGTNTSHALLENNAQKDLIGLATDVKSGEPVYTEIHRFSYQDGMQVIDSQFTRPSGKMLAERRIELIGDKVQTYAFKQFNIDYQEFAERGDEYVAISSVKEGRKSDKKVYIKNPRDIVIDAGFQSFVLRNWDGLLAGKTKRFNFVSVDLANSFRLKVKHDRTENGIEYFKMNIANPFISMLVAPIQAGYYKDTKQLAYYQGMSNIKNDDGKRFKNIEIKFARI